MTDYSNYDYGFIVLNVKFALDTRNATENVKMGKEKIVRLGR